MFLEKVTRSRPPLSESRTQVLHEIFERQADAHPTAAAVIFDGKETSYRELERHANRIARRLRRSGIARGSLVAVMLPRSPDAYASILGILKAGAAYVPIDTECPADRVAYLVDDCRASALVTHADLAARLPMLGVRMIRVDADGDDLLVESPERLPPEQTGVGRRDLCYVIYTSGTTGQPKGVMVEHRSACHLVETEREIYGVRADDRVFQGASLSFDLSVEEIWLAFRAGATLVPATNEMVRSGPDLSRFLRESGVTVLSSVPTLLAMLTDDVPALRLLITGGEACPERLVRHWARPGLRMLNTYGPTETTVIATVADMQPGRPVTIGRAIPGYRIHLLDDDLKPVAPGETGQICIGGVGVARGYLRRPELTREKFVPDPFAPVGEKDPRLYLSGDLGRLDGEGNIEFMGRADSQVKLRGFRIELAEIESVLMQADGVRAAACAVREDASGLQRLVAWVVPVNGKIEEARLRPYLREKLPAYMVPRLIEPVPELPLLPSGKLDRDALPTPRRLATARKDGTRRPRTETERRIAAVWEALFESQPVSIDDDFFLDLGGHSLLAARMVSELRRLPGLAHVSVLDVYAKPTIASLAAALDAAERDSPAFPEPGPGSSGSPGSPGSLVAQARGERPGSAARRHFFPGLLQTLGLYFVFAFRCFQWVTPYLVYFLLVAQGRPVLEAAAWAAASAAAVLPAQVLIAIALKWLVLGRVRPGRYALWSGYHLRWWFAQSMIRALPLDYLAGTPLLPLVFRLLGARIGRDVHLQSRHLAAFDLISIGDGSSIEERVTLSGFNLEDGELVVGPIWIGRDCFIGTRSILREDTVLEDGARIEDLTLVPRGGRIPGHETWEGSPARRVSGPWIVRPDPPPVRRAWARAAAGSAYVALVLLLPLVMLLSVVPGIALLTWIGIYERPLWALAAAPLVGGAFVFFLTQEVVVLKWLALGRVRAGRYPVHGAFYVRKWFADQLLAMSLDYVGHLHATLYVAPWYRALGARLARFVELSTATSTTPDLLEIGEGGTVADEVSFGAARVERGWLTLAPTRIGRRAFLGNSAVLRAGATLGHGSLVGVLSVSPRQPGQAARPDASWLGSPPILLPRRQPSASFGEQRTYQPTRKLQLARGAFELLRVTLPPAGFVFVTTAVVTAAVALWQWTGAAIMLAMLPLVYAACCAVVLVGVAAAKWLIVGRFRPFTRPLWSLFVWRLELANAFYEFLATPLALEALKGTPLLPWYFRLLGAKFGRGVYADSTSLLEFDLVKVGDRVVLNEGCILQTHLFEDRVLKSSWLRIGDDCSIGACSVVLYDAEMQAGARLDALSLAMKGETLPAYTAWTGIPASLDTEAVRGRLQNLGGPSEDGAGEGELVSLLAASR